MKQTFPLPSLFYKEFQNYGVVMMVEGVGISQYLCQAALCQCMSMGYHTARAAVNVNVNVNNLLAISIQDFDSCVVLRSP